MPGPVIYVAIAIGTVAAVVAFKEFVYEPHIAPQFEAWAEARRRHSRRTAVTVPARQNENDARRESPSKRRGSITPENDTMSVELEDIVVRESSVWMSSTSRRGSLRQRKNHSVIEESNVFLPYDPMAPTQVLFDSSDTESTRSFKSARSPAPRHRSVSTEPAPIVSPSPRAATSKAPAASFLQTTTPALPSPVSNTSRASSRATSLITSQMYHSASSSSSFTPAVIGPLRADSVGSRTASSIDATSGVGHSVSSAPGSRVTSPFSDVHAGQLFRSPAVSPFQVLSPNVRSTSSRTALSNTSSPLMLSPMIGSDFSLPSDTEEGMEGLVLSPSLRSGMFSPSVDLARDIHEDSFEVGSVHGSETESWDSFGRRTPEL